MRYLARSLFAAALVFVLAAPARATEALRFSKSLPAAESAELGLAQLDADQQAVLDALVRRDIANWDYVSKTPRADRFSARISASDRHNSGLDLLSEPELVRLDAAVERLMPSAPRGAYAVSSASSSASSASTLKAVKINRAPQIHGSVTLMVAAGSHGYSAYGGGVEVNYTDPASGFGISVAYSEIHSKGGFGGCGFGRYGSGFDRYDPFSPGYPWW